LTDRGAACATRRGDKVVEGRILPTVRVIHWSNQSGNPPRGAPAPPTRPCASSAALASLLRLFPARDFFRGVLYAPRTRFYIRGVVYTCSQDFFVIKVSIIFGGVVYGRQRMNKILVESCTCIRKLPKLQGGVIRVTVWCFHSVYACLSTWGRSG